MEDDSGDFFAGAACLSQPSLQPRKRNPVPPGKVTRRNAAAFAKLGNASAFFGFPTTTGSSFRIHARSISLRAGCRKWIFEP